MRVLAVVLVLGAVGQAAAASWEGNLSAAWYALPDEEDFVQPTLRVDRERLHLETRYNYEDRHATSLFLGANFAWGQEETLALTPMLGVLFGDTDGVVPGLETDFTAGRFEAYGEAEYVVDLDDGASSYFYLWSELSWWPSERWRTGLVAQRTRAHDTDRDIQRGLLVGVSFRRLEGSLYLFNPGSDDHFAVVSFGLGF
ncbi:MAG TPA: hypothetical protein VFV75_19810 [Candidatus Polarisedimenticolaceae bacterium]|nr:hypothetical protein [Candidatus Polarisedimenticolaceae bacterium]